MKKFKQYPILIWFLDDDLTTSAKMLSDYHLHKSIQGCIQALITSIFYFIGIRNKKFYKYFFSKEHKNQTLDRFFSNWPYDKPPLFSNYSSKINKWTRKCQEHFSFIYDYLEILLCEYEFRKTKPHSGKLFFEWIECTDYKNIIPKGNISKIVFEWKSLNPKYRSKNIINGYRQQYKAIFDNDGGPKLGSFTNRDIPEFLLEDQIKEDTIGKWLS